LITIGEEASKASLKKEASPQTRDEEDHRLVRAITF